MHNSYTLYVRSVYALYAPGHTRTVWRDVSAQGQHLWLIHSSTTQCYSLSYNVTVCDTMLQAVIQCYRLRYNVTCCHTILMLQTGTMLQDVIQCYSLLCNVTDCDTMLQSVMQCYRLWYNVTGSSGTITAMNGVLCHNSAL